MNWLNFGDIEDSFYKFKLRGAAFVLGKFSFIAGKRVKNAFNQLNNNTVNYWDIPLVNKHWNNLISANQDIIYEDFVVNQFLSGKKNLKMLSVGCGGGHHELNFAKHNLFKSIKGIDLAPKLVEKANQNATKSGFTHLKYELANFNNFKLESNNYDLVHFYGSLHHFKPVESVLEKIKNSMKPDGILVIHEYVGPNRFQFDTKQLSEINQILKSIPPEYRIKYLSSKIKNRVNNPGIFRMILADPSEAADSESIRPNLKKMFSPLIEVELGGNLIQPLFKDIAHHYMEPDERASEIISQVFNIEKQFITNKKSDFIFGVYQI